MSRPKPARRRTIASWLLFAGCLVGLALAAADLVARGKRAPLPEDAAASVNGVVISRADLNEALRAVAGDRRESSIGPEDRARVLERLIEEELLLQRAIELGLHRADQRARGSLTSAMISAIVAEAEGAASAPSEARLRAHYEAHRDYFQVPGQLRIRQLYFEGPRAEERAFSARQRLERGTTFEEESKRSDAVPTPLPSGLIPVAKFLDYLGPTATRQAASTPVGSASPPVRTTDGVHVFVVDERTDARTPAFEDVRREVENDYVRRAGERALRDYLAGLSLSAVIRYGDE